MDFYVLLGVPQDASPADIKRAYTRLARRYHPGINPGDRAAEAMFQRVVEAYETLSDPGRRRQYDSAGGRRHADAAASSFMFAEFDFSSPRQGQQASTFTELFADVLHPVPGADDHRQESGADIHATVTIPFAEAVHGVERQVLVMRQVLCGGCAGTGHLAAAEGKCRQCQGTGTIRWARGHMVFSKPCSACGGAGRQTRVTCPICTGQGRAVRSEAVPVHVPAGVADGMTLRVPEMGHAGRQGGGAGDLYVAVHVTPHAFFRRQGDDLVCALPVAVHEAALGARINVPSLEGPLKLRVPEGTQGGQRLRVPGRGMPTVSGGRGDLFYEVQLVLPPVLDERSKALMREFGDINSTDVREAFAPKADA
ncbi:MAG TPA: J domain-containing protein [Vicinamibacterales bacterium]|nr:J domain-containing protein [Vicinamibacterales bacterium]